MWLFISLINRSFLHAYITGTLFVIVNNLWGVEKNVFVFVILVGAIVAEYREHKSQNHNYPGDWFSGVCDVGITILIFLFLFVLSSFSNVLSLQQKIVILIGSVVMLYILIFAADLIFKPSKKRHWEPKHFFDIASNSLGPFLISPILLKLIF